MTDAERAESLLRALTSANTHNAQLQQLVSDCKAALVYGKAGCWGPGDRLLEDLQNWVVPLPSERVRSGGVS